VEAKAILSKVEEAWQDASGQWQDEYAGKYKTAVISELEYSLLNIHKATEEINEATEAVLARLRDYKD
jgi:heterodisulfide reductase subunit B